MWFDSVNICMLSVTMDFNDKEENDSSNAMIGQRMLCIAIELPLRRSLLISRIISQFDLGGGGLRFGNSSFHSNQIANEGIRETCR